MILDGGDVRPGVTAALATGKTEAQQMVNRRVPGSSERRRDGKKW